MSVKKTPLALSDTLISLLQEGSVTMTMRALSERDYEFWQDEDAEDGWPIYEDDLGDMYRAPSPYGPVGSLLWVRESYRELVTGEVEYRQQVDPGRDTDNKEWMPVVGMPEVHSRHTLVITDYEFVTDITSVGGDYLEKCGFSGTAARKNFRKYWNKRYRQPNQKWDSKPAVWVVTFSLTTP